MTQKSSGLPSTEVLRVSYLFASAKGWAGGARKTAIPDFPGSKAIRVQMGLILYSDVYWTCPGSEQSFGVTVMSAYDIARVTWIPLWHMQYGGRYPERMIAFLKTALRQTYNAGEFVGGRGPREFSQGGDIFYINDPDPEKNDFREFRGEERILEGGARVGSHWYRGGLLIPET